MTKKYPVNKKYNTTQDLRGNLTPRISELTQIKVYYCTKLTGSEYHRISALKSEYDAVITENNNEVEDVCKSRANTEQKMQSKSSCRRRGFKSKPSFSEKNPFHGFFSSSDLAEISYTSSLSEAGKQAGPSKETEL